MKEPQVFLVGAGPGNAGLLTLRAAECLGRADLVIHDQLVPPRLLEYAPPGARRICVSDLPGCHPERAPHVQHLMIEAARQGQCVVRLKGGDPFLFGRGAEEAEALRRAGIAYEIVPGVTAALGAAAYTGIPLTHRRHASAVALITGHEAGQGGRTLDWAALARFPGTLVVYMGLRRLGQIVRALLEQGKAPDTPAAAVHWATLGRQRTVEAPLADLEEAVRAAGLTSPVITIIGPVAALRAELAWFEQRPLFGKRVLVARPRHQAGGVVQQLEQLGAVVHVLPAVEVREPADWSAVDRALADLASFQWLVFTSSNGVHALVRRLRQTGRDLRALGPLRLAAIGPGTADALRSYHLEPDLVPPEFRSESLAAALKERAAGQRVLLARADRGRDVLRQELAAVAEVEQVAVYSQVDAIEPGAPALDCLRRGEIDYVMLTSANIARALLRGLDEPARARIEAGEVRLVSISPVTSAAVRELGLPVAAEAAAYTTAGVIEAMVKDALARGAGGSGQDLAPLTESFPRQVEHQGAGEDADNVHRGADAAEGNTDKQVEQEQQE
ncbi:MAG TPA: uroporphyrinogen-III C-methyltransferase [Gemmataceae bacterium]|nr:uroporphyrinogen-III C-methyltransferase [Gemmataceae bacterium]